MGRQTPTGWVNITACPTWEEGTIRRSGAGLHLMQAREKRTADDRWLLPRRFKAGVQAGIVSKQRAAMYEKPGCCMFAGLNAIVDTEVFGRCACNRSAIEKPRIANFSSYRLTSLAFRVVWFDNGKNYGFIKRDDTGEDIYVHQEAVRRSNIATQRLRSGMTVKFETVVRKRVGKLMATNLVVLNQTTG